MPILHYHPLSSYCQKVGIAADALGVTLDKRLLNLSDPAERAAFLALWPVGKMPVLEDAGRTVVESTVIIEHLQLHHAAPGRRLIPDDTAAALDVRLWDRLLDQYVMTPMQKCTDDLLRPEGQKDPLGLARATDALTLAYGLIDERLAGREWLTDAGFSLADCAAAPALFYAFTYVPLPAQHQHLAAYFERLLAHPAVAAALDEARPFFRYYPGRAGLAARFLPPEA
jgi:glutathione S-transferase